ncbi:hypothetical protein K501DRAFT_268661 [Backusella circina FSU 941]|nr:hypothetical protein K501DRAFT_268661 [Backusella circina FSU 941]
MTFCIRLKERSKEFIERGITTEQTTQCWFKKLERGITTFKNENSRGRHSSPDLRVTTESLSIMALRNQYEVFVLDSVGDAWHNLISPYTVSGSYIDSVALVTTPINTYVVMDCLLAAVLSDLTTTAQSYDVEVTAAFDAADAAYGSSSS